MYCPVVIMSPPFSFKIKGKHRSKGTFLSPTLLYSTRALLNHQRKDTNNVVGKCWFMRTFSFHQHPKFVSHIDAINVAQVSATECKTRGIVCKHIYNFFRSARNLDCYANFVVVASLLNESIHGFKNVCDGSVLTLNNLALLIFDCVCWWFDCCNCYNFKNFSYELWLVTFAKKQVIL